MFDLRHASELKYKQDNKEGRCIYMCISIMKEQWFYHCSNNTESNIYHDDCGA
jgi:hypothetical protein